MNDLLASLDIKFDNFFLDDNMNLVLGDLGCCHDILNNDNLINNFSSNINY